MAVIPVINGESMSPISDILGIGTNIGRYSPAFSATTTKDDDDVDNDEGTVRGEMPPSFGPTSSLDEEDLMDDDDDDDDDDALGNDRHTLPSLSSETCLPK